MESKGLFCNGFKQTFQQINFDPALDKMLCVYCQLEQRMATTENFKLYTLLAGLNTNNLMTHDEGNN